MYYSDDDMLMLSGIQHFVYCPRQWALIHLDQQWAENRLTAEGEILHQNVDDPFLRQKNGNRITLRSISIASKRLGLYGVTDAVELIPADSKENSITHPKYPGFWHLLPIEYKHGHTKPDRRDEVQVAAQTICLEEQYGIHIEQAALFYFETRSREYVEMSQELRDFTEECARNMHKIFASGILPAISQSKSCRNCSLNGICMPEISKCNAVQAYLKEYLNEETP